MADQPLASVIIANWNGADHLRVALPSLADQTYRPLEVLVVDNGSTDDSHAVARELGATLIALGENKGLSVACNEGARQAKGEYLVFVNNDMRFAPDFVQRLIEPLTTRKDLFATDARQFDWDGHREIHLATRLERRTLIASYFRPGMLPLLDFPQESTQEPSAELQACSAAMAVRRTMFESIGGFDRRLVVSWEDTEICWRAWLREWPTVFVPGAVCWHRVGGSTRNRVEKGTRFRGVVGGRLLFATKHLPAWHVANAWIVSCLGVVKDVLSMRFRMARAKARVLGDQARLAPTLLAERRELYGRATTSPLNHFRKMLSRFPVARTVRANV